MPCERITVTYLVQHCQTVLLPTVSDSTSKDIPQYLFISHSFTPSIFHFLRDTPFYSIPLHSTLSRPNQLYLSIFLSGLWGDSQQSPKPDPAGPYKDDAYFLSELRDAHLTMYSYGAPRCGNPAFCAVSILRVCHLVFRSSYLIQRVNCSTEILIFARHTAMSKDVNCSCANPRTRNVSNSEINSSSQKYTFTPTFAPNILPTYLRSHDIALLQNSP